MRQKGFCIAASCILAVVVLGPVFSISASPSSTEKVRPSTSQVIALR